MISVAVIDARTPGNIGAIARSMKNFGLSDLYLVDPPPIDRESEAYGFAGQAREDILPNARECTFEDIYTQFYTIGCTAVTNDDPTNHVRYPFVEPVDLAAELVGLENDICLVFGRERTGLTNDELSKLDRICSIPAAAEYPVLNLAHAVTIICYELRDLTLSETQHPDDSHKRAAEEEIQGLYSQFDAYLAAIGHPIEKQPKASRMFRRVMGRAHPTTREVRTLWGILRRGAMWARQREGYSNGEASTSYSQENE